MRDTSKTLRVLLVEDYLDDRELIVSAILKSGIQSSCVMYAQNGCEALDLLDRLAQQDSLPDLMLVDLNMPLMNGHEVLDELGRKGILSYLPVIVMSTSDSEMDVRRVYNAGGHSFIVKPSSFDEFVKIMSCISTHLETISQPSSLRDLEYAMAMPA